MTEEVATSPFPGEGDEGVPVAAIVVERPDSPELEEEFLLKKTESRGSGWLFSDVVGFHGGNFYT